jgi:hypothetical protein
MLTSKDILPMPLLKMSIQTKSESGKNHFAASLRYYKVMIIAFWFKQLCLYVANSTKLFCKVVRFDSRRFV